MHVKGFTLIELSIVLVIIGLIVGGVLVGQDLIRAAGVRSTISQIEKYQTAVNTFRGKYGYLPGDIPPSATQQFGFTVDAGRSGIAAEGDGNGVISGSGTYGGSGPQPWGPVYQFGTYRRSFQRREQPQWNTHKQSTWDVLW